MNQPPDLRIFMPPLRDCDRTRGSVNAAIVLMEYGDFQCPRCRKNYFAVKQMVQSLGEAFCFVFRHFPQPKLYPLAQKAAESAEAAGVQNKFWLMHDLLFEHQKELEDADLVEYADRLNLDMPRFLKEMKQHIHAERVQEDIDSGKSNGVTKTPTFFISIRYEETENLQTLLQGVLAALKVS